MRTRKGAARRRQKKRLLKLTRSYWGGRGRIYRAGKETLRRALRYSWAHRRRRKRDFRRLWIARLNAAVRMHGMSYSRFVAGLKRANIQLNRKVLSELAISDPKAFDQIVRLAGGAAEAVPAAQGAAS